MTNREIAAGLKARGRAAILGHLSTIVGAEFFFIVIRAGLIRLTNGLFTGTDFFSILASYVLSYVILILAGIIRYGISLMYLKLEYRQKAYFSDMFIGFRENSWTVCAVQAILSAIDLICMMPGTLFAIFSAYTLPNIAFDIVLLQLGQFAAFLIKLGFTPAFFLLLDYPDLKPRKILESSLRLMKGNRLTLLYMELSFFPLYLLGILSLGISNLWTDTYRNASVAAFYRGLIASRQQNT